MAGAAAYLALAAVGMGGVWPFLTRPPLAALVLAFLAMSVAAPFVGGNISPGVREDRGNRWVLLPFVGIGLLSAYLPALADRMGFWSIGGDGVRWLGVGLFVVGGAVRLWPVAVLGDRFSGLVAIQPGHRLVTDGIYRTIRNPSYLGLVMNGVGWGLAFGNWVGVVLAALFLPPLVARMHAEERLLHEHFGAEYDAYRARTWRLVPGIY